MPANESTTGLTATAERVRQFALALGIAGLIVCAICYFARPAMFFRVYLTAYLYCLGFPLGSLAVALIYRLTGGQWGRMIVRPLEAASRTLPLAALLFVPIVIGLHSGQLYPWNNPSAVGGDPAPAAKAGYLTVTGFEVRAAIYFIMWLIVARVLHGWSKQVAEGRAPERRLTLFAGPGLLLLSLSDTLAAIDWQMSLEPHWYSTIFPVVYAMGQILAAFALAVLMICRLAPPPILARPQGKNVLQDLGSLQLAFVMIWAYVSFSQLLLIWSGNLPEEIAYYVPRLGGGWQYVGGFLAPASSRLPFVMLLFARLETQPAGSLGRLVLVSGGDALGGSGVGNPADPAAGQRRRSCAGASCRAARGGWNRRADAGRLAWDK